MNGTERIERSPERGAPAIAIAALAVAGCGAAVNADATRAVDSGDSGWPVLSLRWAFELADHSGDTEPQEFAGPAVLVASSPGEDRLFVGSQAGTLFSLDAYRGEVVWKRKLGSVSSRPTLSGDLLYVGTDDGHIVALDPTSGTERWRYATRGPILESPVVSGDLILLSNEADQVYALDRHSGKFRWHYKNETPEEFTLRGHAGVVADGDLVFTGFANGTLVALRTTTGSVAWLTSLKGDADRFVDVDATPVTVGDHVYAVASAGGVYSVDKTTGLVRWRLPIEGGGALTTDGERLFVAAAEQGVYAIDLAGNVVWRQGTRGGGEPAGPVAIGDYLLYSLSDAGLYVADKRTGRVRQFFDPGYGISAVPTLARDRMYVVSNSAILYAMTLRHFVD